MMAGREGAERVQPEDRAAWRAWLDEHHGSSTGVWLVTWKKHTGKATLPCGDAVEEALGRRLDRQHGVEARRRPHHALVHPSILEWVRSAKRGETRRKWIEEAATLAARGERANQ